MERRHFLAGMLVLGAAPAIVRASSLMKVRDITRRPILVDWALIEKCDFYGIALEEYPKSINEVYNQLTGLARYRTAAVEAFLLPDLFLLPSTPSDYNLLRNQ